MDNMIRQVALLAEMIKGVKENRAKSMENGSAKEEEGVKRAEKKEPAEAEEESEALPKEKGTEEMESDEARVQDEEKLITTPPEDYVSKEILEEACDESYEYEETIKREEAIECGEEIDNSPLYLQPSIVHAL